uniref:RNA-directed DNA polymerase n=1 Tax=Photinus pyralis TaxID=7054 RepID=A0A1Y1LMU5_PHOPY
MPLVLVEINNIRVLALLDTGASYNFISAKFVSKLNKIGTVKYTPCSSVVMLPDSSMVRVRKQVKVFVRIASLSWPISFYEFSSLNFDVILGIPSLNKMKVILNFESKNISFEFNRDIKIPFSSSPNLRKGILSSICEVKYNLNQVQNQQIASLITQFSDVLTKEVGIVRNFEYEIKVSSSKPIYKTPFYLNPVKQKELDDHLQHLLEKGIIRRSTSPYASPVFFVPKKDSGKRLVVDYRAINKIIEYDPFPPANQQAIFAYLQGAKIFTLFDMNAAFHQIQLAEDSKKYTAFVTPTSHYEYNYLPFGLKISPTGLNRLIAREFADIRFKFLINYFDDFIVFSKSPSEHITHLQIVLERFRMCGITLNPEKARFAMSKLRILGHVVSSGCVQLDPQRIEAVQNLPIPKSVKQVQQFIGIVSFCSKFIDKFSEILAPLNELKRKDSKFKITDKHILAIDNLKKAICEAPVLRLPDFSIPFIVRTDASNIGISGVLLQKQEDGIHPIAFVSKKLSDTEKKYSTYEKESLAVMFALDKFKDYVTDSLFTLQVDCDAIRWLVNHPSQLSKFGRWILKLSKFNFTIEHIPGSQNNVADGLSRLFDDCQEPSPSADTQHSITFLNSILELPESFVSINKHQQSDEFCELIRNRLQSGQDVNNFAIENGLLIRYVGRNRLKRVVIPEKLYNLIIYYFHDSKFGNHNSVTKTYRSIAKRFWWNAMYKQIRNYVSSCHLCQTCKPLNTQVNVHLASSSPTVTWDKIYVDYVGPIITSEQGYRFMLVCVDSFSKWLKVYPTRKATAKVTCKYLTELFSTYGPPKTLVSDNAKCFTSNLLFQFCMQWGVRQAFSSPYHPASNMSERCNRNLKYNLTLLIKQYALEHKSWDQVLPFFILNYNSTHHEAIGTSPANIFLNRDIATPLDNIWNLESFLARADPPNLQEIHNHLKVAHEKAKKYYNRGKLPVTKFKINQKVLVKHFPTSVPRVSDQKFTAIWSGPKIIRGFTSPVSVVLEDIETNEITRSHIQFLRPYKERNS